MANLGEGFEEVGAGGIKVDIRVGYRWVLVYRF